MENIEFKSEFNYCDESMLDGDITLCNQSNETLLPVIDNRSSIGSNKPRQSVLVLFDPLYGYGETNSDLNEKPVEEFEHPQDSDLISDIHSVAKTLVNFLIETAVLHVEDKVFSKNHVNVTLESQDDMPALYNKIQNYEDEILGLKLLLKQKEEDEIVRIEKLQKLEDQIDTNSKYFGNIIMMLMQYEKLAIEHIAEFKKLNKEHNTSKLHLANLELSFSDLLQKYERSKEIINTFKCNEDTLKGQLQALEETCNAIEEKYESLKAHARSQLEKVHQELQILRAQSESEIIKLNAVNKRLEIKNHSLADSLDQKSKECLAIAALCDEVTAKV